MTVDYGYEQAAPDSKTLVLPIEPSPSAIYSRRWTDNTNAAMKDVMPSVPVKKSSILSKDANAAANMYGYGDAVPDSEVDNNSRAAPLGRTRSDNFPRQTRRSSMKKGGSGTSRRASIGYTGEIVVQLPGRSRPVRRRTSISFADEDEVCEVTPAKEMAQPKQLWFSDEENTAIREKCCFLVELMRAAEDHPEAQAAIRHYNLRGLENHVESGPSVEQDQAWYSVFLEQYLQRNEGVFNDNVISQVYKRNTWQSQQVARDRAKQDAIDIETYTQCTRRQMRRLSLM